MDTSSSFTRPGEYFSIQLDQDGIPHVAWSDGRNDEMDIYYAHGLAAETTELLPAEVVIALVGVFLLVVIVLLAYAKKR